MNSKVPSPKNKIKKIPLVFILSLSLQTFLTSCKFIFNTSYFYHLQKCVHNSFKEILLRKIFDYLKQHVF